MGQKKTIQQLILSCENLDYLTIPKEAILTLELSYVLTNDLSHKGISLELDGAVLGRIKAYPYDTEIDMRIDERIVAFNDVDSVKLVFADGTERWWNVPYDGQDDGSNGLMTTKVESWFGEQRFNKLLPRELLDGDYKGIDYAEKLFITIK